MHVPQFLINISNLALVEVKNMKTWKKFFPILAVVLLLIPAIVHAQIATLPSTTSSNANVNEQYPNYTSSIRVPDNYTDQQLMQLAKITSTQAKEFALKNVTGGTVASVSLENENGNLVYSVQITKSLTKYDVKVDAGNGNILFIEQGTGSESNASERGIAED
ncbi:MAG: PepSY domain-containing protein [Thermoproteota archaeon]